MFDSEGTLHRSLCHLQVSAFRYQKYYMIGRVMHSVLSVFALYLYNESYSPVGSETYKRLSKSIFFPVK